MCKSAISWLKGEEKMALLSKSVTCKSQSKEMNCYLKIQTREQELFHIGWSSTIRQEWCGIQTSSDLIPLRHCLTAFCQSLILQKVKLLLVMQQRTRRKSRSE